VKTVSPLWPVISMEVKRPKFGAGLFNGITWPSL
jgi:hypothetical protein